MYDKTTVPINSMEDSGIESESKSSSLKENFLQNSINLDETKCYSAKNNSTKQLQKKLEAKIEKAKQIYNENEHKKSSTSLIPIQRLSIPNVKYEQPLVNWESEESDEDTLNFFELSSFRKNKHQELVDTFSIEEMSITGEEDNEDDLNLVSPSAHKARINCCNSMCVIF